jgi:hypothetical protein
MHLIPLFVKNVAASGYRSRSSSTEVCLLMSCVPSRATHPPVGWALKASPEEARQITTANPTTMGA